MRSTQGNRKTSTRQVLHADVDLTPIMCLFIILVPLLLVSAVFERLSALQVHLPEASTIEETEEAKEAKEEEPTGIVELRLLVKEDGLGLEATLSHDPSGEEKRPIRFSDRGRSLRPGEALTEPARPETGIPEA